MKKVTSALALAALLGAPALHASTADFGGDFDWRGYTVDDGAADNLQGYDMRIRLKGHFATDDGVQVNTRLQLTDSHWAGDNAPDDTAAGQGPFGGRAASDVQLDYGFVQFPLFGWTTRIGRQEANWGFNLTTSDDRRDRILTMNRFGTTTVLLGHDKRAEGDLRDDDGDNHLWFAAGVGMNAGWLWGVLLGHFEGENYVLDGANLLGPFVQGQAGPVKITAALHYLGGGEVLWTEDTIAGFVRGGFDVADNMNLEAQFFFNAGGSLVANGFDSFSSLIHNSPDHNASRSTIGGGTSFIGTGLGLGGMGTAGEDSDMVSLLAARANFQVTPEIKLVGALGWVNYDKDSANVDESVTFQDFQAHYQVTPSTSAWLAAGFAQSEDYIDEDVSAVSLNLRTNF